MSVRCEIHPIYGAVPRDGDNVREGDIIGLSVDGSRAIAAPCAGTIRTERYVCDGRSLLRVEILPTGGEEKEAGSEPTSISRHN
jgi:hypothetical protein